MQAATATAHLKGHGRAFDPSIQMDEEGHLYFDAGRDGSDLQTTLGALRKTRSSGSEVFVLKINVAGGSPEFRTERNVEPTILEGAVRILDVFGGLQAAIRRSVEVRQRRRQHGVGGGMVRRPSTWQTAPWVVDYFRSTEHLCP